jgi:RHS repeat-associated protein
VWRNDNTEPFGDSVPNENPSGLGAFEFPLRFPGQYADKETNLAYNWMRDYDGAIGRYIQSDPIGLEGGINMYVYVVNRPLEKFDSKGTDIEITGGNRSSPPNMDVMLGLGCMSQCLRTTIYLESGRRTPEHDREVGGTGSGPHTRGIAADVLIFPSESKIRKAAAECGFYVLPKHYGDGHVHIDLRDARTAKEYPDECVCKRIRGEP